MVTSLLLAAVLLAGTPYEDTLGRFAIDLAPGWALAPAFGDTSGMRFARTRSERRGGGRVSLTVEVREEVAPEGWADAVEAQARAEGLRVQRGASRVGGRPATRVTARGAGRVERSEMFGVGARAYRVAIEGRARDVRSLAEDVQAMLQSFRPREGAGPSAAAPAPPPAVLLGVYESAAGTVLRFEPGGRFRLEDTAGAYEVEGDRLTLHPAGGRPVRFTFALADGALTLRSDGLPAPTVYRKKELAPASPTAVAGRWRAPGASGPVDLELSADGRFRLRDIEGQWVLDGDMLRLRKTDTDIVSYRCEVSAGRLRLSGGDLDDPVVFEAIR